MKYFGFSSPAQILSVHRFLRVLRFISWNSFLPSCLLLWVFSNSDSYVIRGVLMQVSNCECRIIYFFLYFYFAKEEITYIFFLSRLWERILISSSSANEAYNTSKIAIGFCIYYFIVLTFYVQIH